MNFGGVTFSPRVTALTKADVTAGGATAWTTANTGLTLFTVTGDVLLNVWGAVTTPLTSTGANGTLAVGTAASTGGIIAATTVDGTKLHTAKYIWASTAGTPDILTLPNTSGWYAVSGTNIVLTIATNSMSAGGMTLYCIWMPISSGASVS